MKKDKTILTSRFFKFYSGYSFLGLIILSLQIPLHAQWRSANYGTYAGAINTVAVAPNGSLIAGAFWDGIYKSDDEGLNWIASNHGIETVDNRYPTLLTSGSKIFLGCVSGIFSSTDNGSSWNLSGAMNNYVRAMFKSGSNIIASTTGKILISKDNGNSWMESNTGMATPSVVAFAESGGDLLGIWESTILSSTDNGETWTELSILPGSFNSAYDIISFGSSVYCITNNGLYKSIDSGLTWSLIDATKTYGKMVVVNGELILATDKNIFKSPDGIIWITCNANLNQAGAGQFALTNGKIYLATLKGGLLYSVDQGLNWELRDNGLVSPRITALAAMDRTFIAATSSGLRRSDDECGTWTQVQSASDHQFTQVLSFGGRFIAGSTDAGIQISDDQGITWNSSNIGLTNLNVTSLTAIGSNLWAGTTNGLFYSNNRGDSWITVNVSGQINAITGEGTIIYVSLNPFGVMKSVDSGVTWSQVNDGLPSNGLSEIISMAVFSGTVYAATYVGIYKTDFGNSWTVFNNTPSFSLSADSNNLYFGSTNSEVFAFTGLSTIPLSYPNHLLLEPAVLFLSHSSKLYAVYNSNTYTGAQAGTIYFRSNEAIPAVSGFTPLKGKVGSTITITGINLSGSNRRVLFNGFDGTILSSTPTSLTVSVPSTGGLASIKVIIGQYEAILSNKFSVLPEITYQTPTAGIPGTKITIKGTGFDIKGIYEIKFNSTSGGYVTPQTSTSIITYAPSFAFNEPIAIIAGDETLYTKSTFQVIPYITDFFPKEGNVGSDITISGLGFSNLSGNNKVSFNGVNAVSVSENYTTIVVKVPAGAKSGLISAMTYDFVANSKSAFTLLPLSYDCSWGPQIPTITQEGLQSEYPVLKSSSIGGNLWYLNGKLFDDSGIDKITATKSGAYTLKISIDGCKSSLSQPFPVIVTGIENISEEIKIFPNPVLTSLILDLRELKEEEEIRIEIYPTQGNPLYKGTFYGGTKEYIDVGALIPGIYFVKVLKEGKSHYQKLIKQ